MYLTLPVEVKDKLLAEKEDQELSTIISKVKANINSDKNWLCNPANPYGFGPQANEFVHDDTYGTWYTNKYMICKWKNIMSVYKANGTTHWPLVFRQINGIAEDNPYLEK